ncbi:MAG: DUF6065 family protein, partial [Fimbriiglobus sp.]
MPAENLLTAYLLADHVPSVELLPAPIDRAWMDAAPQRFPYRCLPLAIANQCGWILTSPASFQAYWYGGHLATDIELR